MLLRKLDDEARIFDGRLDLRAVARLRRRYLKRVEIDGETKPLLASFEIGKDGWEGVTAFPPDEAAYLDKQRRGTLAFRRPDRAKAEDD